MPRRRKQLHTHSHNTPSPAEADAQCSYCRAHITHHNSSNIKQPYQAPQQHKCSSMPLLTTTPHTPHSFPPHPAPMHPPHHPPQLPKHRQLSNSAAKAPTAAKPPSAVNFSCQSTFSCQDTFQAPSRAATSAVKGRDGGLDHLSCLQALLITQHQGGRQPDCVAVCGLGQQAVVPQLQAHLPG